MAGAAPSVVAPGYGLSSLLGTYAVAINGEGGRAPFAAMGLLRFDGEGRVTGVLSENRAAQADGQRELVDVSYGARYELEADGLGTIMNGDQEEMRFVVQRSIAADGRQVVEEIALIFRLEDQSTSAIKTGFAIRRPDGIAFDQTSLRGRYAGMAVGRAPGGMIVGLGVNVYDGEAGFAETNVASVPSADGSGRAFAQGQDRGRFALNADGIGAVADGQVLNIVTRCAASDGAALALEYWFMMRNVTPSGAHFTGVMRRISD